ncbi:HNH endonuclease [Campylobacterota bacterium]
MAFWWVSQNKTYKKEMPGGYLWAPKKGKSKNPPHYWTSLLRVQEGDVIFSSYNQKIVALSSVLSKAYDSNNPFPKDENEWEKDGYKIDASYHELDNTIEIKNISIDLFKILQVYHGPLNVNKHVNEGYLFELSDEAGSIILSIIESQNIINIEREFTQDIEKTNINPTTKKSLVDSRIGQGTFRDALKVKWNEKCSVTGIDLVDILIASHIKPWASSNNQERLDVHNGLLLSPLYDKLFDAGYISFNNDGKIIISSVLSNKQIDILNISKEDTLTQELSEQSKKFLFYHRNSRLLPRD